MTYRFDNPLIGKAVQEALLERVINDVYLDRPLEARVKNNFDTACWTFDKDKHYIFMGDNILPAERIARDNLTDEQRVRLYKAFMHHELAHAHWTVRNFKLMNTMCQSLKVPFSLLNLMEDARIEERHRQAYGKKLGWAEFTTEPVSDGGNPEALLFKMIEEETPDVEASSPELYERVRPFYDRIIKAPDTLSLRPILKDWAKEFEQEMKQQAQQQQSQQGQGQGQSQSGGQPQQGQGQGQGQGQAQNSPGQPGGGQEGTKEKDGAKDKADGKAGKDQAAGAEGEKGKDKPTNNANALSDRDELPLGQQLSENEQMLQQFIEDSMDASEAAMPSGNAKGKGADKDTAAYKFASRPNSIDPKEVDELANNLAKLMTTIERKEATHEPTTRLNKRAMSNSSRPDYVRKVLPQKKKLNITLIVDCSGSMGGQPEKDATTLAAALHLLATRGFVEGTLIASTTAQCWAYKFSDEKSVTEVYARPSAEGLERSMGIHEKALKESDAILVFTDGQLADHPVNKPRWHAKGIHTIGLYTGSMEHGTYLQQYFDKSIIRENISELGFALQKAFSKTGLSKTARDRGR